MTTSPAAEGPEQIRVVPARLARSANPIHRDVVAWWYGFRRGLAPGTLAYGWLAARLHEGLGQAWLTRGAWDARFRHPLYPGDTVRVRHERPEGPEPAMTVHAANRAGVTCVQATGSLPAAPEMPVSLADFPAAAICRPVPPATEISLAPGRILGALDVTMTASLDSHYAEPLGSDGDLTRSGLVHPAVYLGLANALLAANVIMPPWIATRLAIRYTGGLEVGDQAVLRGRVAARWIRNGARYVAIDLCWTVGDTVRAQANYEAAYQLRPRLVPRRAER